MASEHGGPNNQSPSGNISTVPSSKCNQSSMPVCAPDNCPPHETSGPRGEGTCDNDTVPALANVKMGEAGHMPRSSSGYLGYGYVMSLYNTCCYILIAALSAISLSESTEEEEDQEKEEEKEEEGGGGGGILRKQVYNLCTVQKQNSFINSQVTGDRKLAMFLK